jgi:hypothetical protein
MRIRIRLTDSSRKSLVERLQQAYSRGHIRLVKRIHALLYVVDGESVAKVSALLHLGEQTVRVTYMLSSARAWTAWCTRNPLAAPLS